MKIFIDTEFTDFGDAMSLISIGLAAEDARTFYGERGDFQRSLCSDFVRTCVLPQLCKQPERVYTESGLANAVLEWLQTYVNQYPTICFDYDGDWKLFTRLLGRQYPDWLARLNVYRCIDALELEQCYLNNNLARHHALNDARANLASCHIERIVR